MGKMSKIFFRIRYNLRPGEKIFLSGNSPLLGDWNPELAKILKKGEKKNIWSCIIQLKRGHSYSYKYLVKNQNKANLKINGHQNLFWENIERNRTIKVFGNKMEVDDCFFGKIINSMTEARIKIKWENSVKMGEIFLDKQKIISQSFNRLGKNLLMILYRLPIKIRREKNQWIFSWDDDALYLTLAGLRKGLKEKINFLWIGILNYEGEIPVSEEENISCILLEKFNCIPVFLSSEIKKNFYQVFCKGVLWPIFHSFNDFLDNHKRTKIFDKNLWIVYCLVNRKFAEIAISVYQDGDLIWIHDYHLMVVPSHLRKSFPGAKIGYFFHIPWPSSEIYRQLPMRGHILRGLLSSSLLGFHLFFYVRHFLSSCVRILKLNHENHRGVLKIQYGGRFSVIRVSHIGIDPTRFGEGLSHPKVSEKIDQIKKKLGRKKIIGAIDDLDVIKGIPLKLLAFESLLDTHPNYRQDVLFIQIAIPNKLFFKETVRAEVNFLVKRINKKFGSGNNSPVMYIEREISFQERLTIYSISDIFFITPLRDGLNLIPYEYIISASEGKGQLILSEFTGCSRSLTGAFRINPWNVEEVSRILEIVLQNDHERIRLNHAADFKYISEHTTKEWAQSFLCDLKRTPEPSTPMTNLGLGFGLTFQIKSKEGPSRINFENFSDFYRKAEKRLLLFDFGESSHLKYFPSFNQKKILESFFGSFRYFMEILSRDPKNLIIVLSERTRDILHSIFGSMKTMGVSSENGFFHKLQRKKNWEPIKKNIDLSWVPIVWEIMRSYTERTDGAFTEKKAGGLVWHFGRSDPQFGYWQAKEMFNHLKGSLDSFGVRITWEKNLIRVQKKEFSKKKIIKKILKILKANFSPDLVFFIGDGKIDKEIFTFFRQKIPKFSTEESGINCGKSTVFFNSPEEKNFFEIASIESLRNSLENWIILNRDNYKNKPGRIKLSKLC